MKNLVRETTNVFWKHLKILLVFMLAILASISMLSAAENETNSSASVIENISLNWTDGNASLEDFNLATNVLETNVLGNNSFNMSLENISINETLNVSSNLTNVENISEVLKEFIFDVIIEEASYVDVETINRIPTNLSLNESTINIANSSIENSTSQNITYIEDKTVETKLELRGFIDTYLAWNRTIESLYSAVEFDIYYDYVDESGNANTGLDICYYYVNGTSEFSCLVTNASKYTLVAITDYENMTYYRYANINESIIFGELVSNVSVNTTGQVNAKDDLTLNELVGKDVVLNDITFNASFEEAYEGSIISGVASLNDSLINSTLFVQITNRDSNKSQICEYLFNNTFEFACELEAPVTGLYDVNVTAKTVYGNMSVYELTYLEAPELRIRIVHEGTYDLDDIVQLRSFATYDNGLIDPEINFTVVMPSGSEIAIFEKSPYIEIYAEELGYHRIVASAYYKGQFVNLSVGFVVGDNGKVGYDENLTVDVSDEFDLTNVSATNLTLLEIVSKPREINLSNISFEIEDIYEIESIVPVILDLRNISINETEADDVNASITITDPINSSIEFVAEFINNKSEMLYLALEPGDYSAVLEIETNRTLSTLVNRTFRALNKTDFAVQKYITPAMRVWNNSKQGRVNLSELRYDAERKTFDVIFNLSNSSRALIRGIHNFTNLRYVQSAVVNDSKLATEVFAIDDINLTEAQITLAKQSDENITKILHCENWNETSLACENNIWNKIDIPFVQNETHIVFNVTHFTAYAGGLGNNSQMSIWDISDIDKDNLVAYIDTLVNFTANYTDNLTGVMIENAICNITLDGIVYGMANDTTSGLYYFNTTIPNRGLYDYTINCSNATYDPLSATDNITIYSVANITGETASDIDMTLGYNTTLECSVVDGYSSASLENYNVSFYSSEVGFIGWSETNTSGIATMNYKPQTLGTQTIICNITDNETNYYKASASGEGQFDLNVYRSKLKTTKDVNYNSSGIYNVTLEIENYGQGTLYNVTVADFVTNNFRADFINSSDWNISVSNMGLGTLYYWNISSILPGEKIVLDYIIVNNSTLPIYDISKSYILGQTYYLPLN